MIVKVVQVIVLIVTKVAAHLRRLDPNVKTAALLMMIALEPRKVVHIALMENAGANVKSR